MNKDAGKTGAEAMWFVLRVSLGALLFLATGIATGQIPDEPRTFIVNGAYTGEDEEGTIAQPFKTISAAMALTIPELGDTVRVWPGEYDERFLVPPDVTLISEMGPDETFIVGDANVQEVLLALTDGALLQGFTLGPTGGNSVLVPDDSDVTVRNCVMFGGFAGIGVASGGTVRAINNTFYGNTVSINVEGGGTVADARNNIFAADSVGILLAEGASATTAYNNFFGTGPAISGGEPSETDFGGNPGIVDGAERIFHVARVSITRDAGDPAAAFNDIDGTRNSLGAYGGPHATPDRLAPRIAVEADVTSEEPFSVAISALGSEDASGIAEYAFDADLSDGTQFEPSLVPGTTATYDAPGLYLAAARVTDNEGNSSEVRFYVGTGLDIPQITASKRASDGPFRTNLGAIAEGSIARVNWDLDSDGAIDTRGFNATYLLPEGALPGNYWSTVLVEMNGGLPAQIATIPLTLTEAPVVAVKEVFPAMDNTITAALGGPIAGGTLTLESGALSEVAAGAIAQPRAADYLAPPTGTLLAIAEFGPADAALSKRAKVSLPFTANIPDNPEFHVYRWDYDGELWNANAGFLARVTEGSPARVEFEIPRLGLYAVSVSDVEDDDPGNGGNGGGGIQCRPVDQTPVRPASMAGDGMVAGALMMALMVASAWRNRRIV